MRRGLRGTPLRRLSRAATERRLEPGHTTPRGGQRARRRLDYPPVLRQDAATRVGLRQLLAGGCCMLGDIAHETEDVIGYEPADRPARVDADDHSTVGTKHEPRRLEVDGIVVDEGPRRLSDGVRICAVSDREGKAVLYDELPGRVEVVDRQRDDVDVALRELLMCALEGTQLCVAVGAPRSPVKEHDTEVLAQRGRELERLAADGGDRDGRKLGAWLQQ